MGNKENIGMPVSLHRYIMGGLLLLIVGIGTWLSLEARNHADANIRGEMLRQAGSIASGLSMENIRDLAFRAEDAERPAFQRITGQLQAYSQTMGMRRLYTLGLRDSQLFFGPAGLLSDDPYATPPGTIHQKPSPADFEAFNTAEHGTPGLHSDEFGEFISALVPVFDPLSGKVLLVVGLDMEASVWRKKLRQAQRIPVWSTLSILGLLLLGYRVHGVYKRSPHMRVESLRNIQVSIYFAVMILLTVIAFICMREVEQGAQQELFRAEANAKSQHFTETTEQIDLVLHLLIGFFEASENIAREEFGSFCRHIFEGYPIQSCFWLPAWSATDVTMLTARMQTEGLPDFSIRRFANDNRPVQDPSDPIYPAVYVEPASQLPTTLGYDFYSHPVLRDTLVETLRTGADHACMVSAPAPTSTEPSGFFVFVPISHTRHGGFVCCSINLDALIKGSNPSSEIPTISATLFELQAGRKPRPLSCSSCNQCDAICDQCKNMLEADLSAGAPLFAFGNTYMMLFTAEPSWFASHPQRTAWWVLGIGLTLSLLLTYTAAVLINRPLLLAKQVMKRTRQLAESKGRSDIAISAAKMGLWEHDMVSNQLIWNDRMLEIYGVEKEGFDGDLKKWREYIHPEDHNNFVREFWAAEHKEKDFNTEFRIVRTGGEIRHIRAFGKMIREEGRTPLRIIGVNLDITEEIEHERKFRIMFEHMHSGGVIYEAIDDGQDFVFSDINAAGRNYSNLQRQDVRGRRVTEVFPDVKDMGLFEALQRVWRTGTQEDLPLARYEDNRIDEWLENHIFKLSTGQIVAIYNNITERKQAEEKLVRLSAAIEQSPESIVITDTKGDIQYANPAFEKSTGYTADDALGQNSRILKSEEHPPSFYAEMWEILLSGKNWEGRITSKRKDGTLFTEEATISPIRDNNGRTINYVGIKRDISRELAQEEELRQAQKMEAVGELAGGVAHDFNNILQGIIGFSELLRYSLDEASQEYDNATEIHTAANRAAKLTQQLLTFSRKQAVRLEEIDLNNAVYDSEALLHVLLGDQHELVLDLPDELPPAYADQSQLTQIIVNLAVNARDAMPEGGRLSISTECILINEADAAYISGARPGLHLCLAITDTGSGMDAETINRIFEPFFTTKELGAGTGLGLSVIYGIVTQNGGWINVYSEVGKGSCFKVYLPVAESNEENAVSDPATVKQGRNARILLIEDDPSILNMVKKVLGEADLTIIAAGSAEDGLALFDQYADGFDLLMSDMELPGMRGDELAEALRIKDSELPVLLFSGYRDQVHRWKNIAEKGYVFLNKPFTITILLDTVRNILNDKMGTNG